jgi:hypothetical protein
LRVCKLSESECKRAAPTAFTADVQRSDLGRSGRCAVGSLDARSTRSRLPSNTSPTAVRASRRSTPRCSLRRDATTATAARSSQQTATTMRRSPPRSALSQRIARSRRTFATRPAAKRDIALKCPCHEERHVAKRACAATKGSAARVNRARRCARTRAPSRAATPKAGGPPLRAASSVVRPGAVSNARAGRPCV